jgi:cytoskeletal protein CcmA (bactofilin family)
MSVRLQFRRGTAAEWTSANPVLFAGEIGFESDTKLIKVGDGSTAWSSLAYSTVSPSSVVEQAQDAVNTALTAGTGITKSYNDNANTISISIGQDVGTTSNVTFNDVSVSGDLTVDGSLTVSGTTTSVNTTNLEIEDKNIVIAKVATSVISTTGSLDGFTGSDPFVMTLTGLDSTDGVAVGMNISATAGTGTFGTGANSITVTSIPSSTSLTVTKSGGTIPTVGTISNITVSASDVTANGAGITVQGTTNKTFTWNDTGDTFTSSEHITVANGKSFYGNLTGDVTGNVLGSLTGNATTASALQNPVTINGTSFNGSSNVTVTAAAGTLTGNTLNSGVTLSSLTSVGTITSGTWNGTAVALTHGGTGATTQAGAANAILPAQANNVSKLLTTDGTDVSWTNAPSVQSLTVNTNDLDVGSQSNGLRTTDSYTNPMAVFSTDADDDYAQLVIKNTGNGTNSSTDLIAYANNGNDTAGWIDLGIASSTFADPSFTITGANDGYIFMEAPVGNVKDVSNKELSNNVVTLTTSSAHGFSTNDEVVVSGVGTPFDGIHIITGTPTGTTFTYAKSGSNVGSTVVSPVGEAKVATGDGNLVLATGGNGARNKIVFAAGGLSSDNTQMEITPDVNVHIEIPTPSTSSTTGAFTVVGGVGIQGDMNLEGNLDVNGDVDFSGVQHLPIGANAFTFSETLTNPVITAVADKDDYQQIAFKNESNHPNASTDFIAYADNGTDSDGYIDMGITSSAFSDPLFTITGENDGYIFMVAPANTVGNGDLVLATGNTGARNAIVFAAGGLASDNTQVTIIPDQNVHIEIPTPSTSPSTGALTVVGGVGILGDMNIQGNVDVQGTIVFGGAGTTVETSNLAVSDPMIYVGNANPADQIDLAFVGEYKSNSVTKYTGIARDASDGIYKLFNNANTKPASTVNFAEAGLGYADLRVGGFTANSATIGSVTNTEIGYLSGVTSPIQTQISAKLDSSTASSTYAPINNPVFTGTVSVPTSIEFEGSTADANETILTVTNPTADRTITLPDATGTVSLVTGSETLQNKTINLSNNTLTGTAAQFNTALSDADFATLDGSETLTSKTINLANNTISGTIAQFNTALSNADFATLAGTETLTNKTLTAPVITGTTKVQQLLEKATVSATAATGTVNYDLLTNGSVTYYTSNASANWTLNLRGDGSNTLNSVMSTGDSLTVAFLVTQSTAYYATAFQIDGSAITPKWQDGTAPTSGNANSIDIYTYTVIKTGNAAYTVFASRTKFA